MARMDERPFPDDQNAEVCIHTGGRAYAVIGGLDRDRVSGWYGSAVIDGDTMVCVDDDMRRGFISDAALRSALADGRVYDPYPILSGETRIADVPDRVILALLGMGMASATRMLERGSDRGHGPEDQLPIPPTYVVGADDPLAHGMTAALLGNRRERGPDLEDLGRYWATLAKARGRPTTPEARDAAAKAILARFRGKDDLVEMLMGGAAAGA